MKSVFEITSRKATCDNIDQVAVRSDGFAEIAREVSHEPVRLAEPANPAIAPGITVPETLLDDGEIVFLAIKPAAWFVIIVSLPGIALAMALAASMCLLAGIFNSELLIRGSVVVGGGGVSLRLVIASFQWLGRLYVLTNRRVFWTRSIGRIDLHQRLLHDLTAAALEADLAERTLALGSLYFIDTDGRSSDDGWVCIARPQEVKRIVDDAISQAGANNRSQTSARSN